MDENVSNEQPIKNRKGLSVLFNIIIILLSVIALSVAGILIYQKRYLEPFWVNGQSMYPTLNRLALDPNGQPLGVNGGGATVGCTKLDYGAMDPHERAIKKVKRFDIVVCKYKFGDESDKIKRVIGLPGETIKFGQGDNNGELYVKKDDNFTFIEQPIENQYIEAGFYPSGEIVLGNDEYYVLGDNRGHSSDSRAVGPIKRNCLVGKVVCIHAHCDVEMKEDGSLESTNIDHFIPRFL